MNCVIFSYRLLIRNNELSCVAIALFGCFGIGMTKYRRMKASAKMAGSLNFSTRFSMFCGYKGSSLLMTEMPFGDAFKNKEFNIEGGY